MPLSIGEKLGVYEILAPLGAGGMGEVYRARDTTLKREVAVKVLPDLFTTDPGRLLRFQREAEVLASLDHPNIGAIHGLVESHGARALVLALVEGQTLEERIAAGLLPPEESIEIAKQIIAALEYAHEHGVMHRDLKPANVKITQDGVVKVLDFGLAKVLEEEQPATSSMNSPTLTIGHTRAGVILGTAAYMSPEQAIGRAADRRSDIFSFGSVFFEMLAGQRAFTGGTAPETLASVVKEEPDWSKLPAEVPAAARTVLRRCLVKDRKQRMQAIGEARIALDAPPSLEASPTVRPSWLTRMAWTAAALMTAIAAVALWGWLKPAPAAARPLIHFATALPPGGNAIIPLVLSRDGSKVLIAGANPPRLYIRTLDDPAVKPVAGTEGARFSTFSPNAEWIAFISGNQLKKVPASGGAALTLYEGAVTNPLSWGEDDNILFSATDRIVRIPASGGKAVTLATADPKNGELALLSPQLLPGTNYIRVSVLTNKGLADLRVVALNPQTRERKAILEGAGDARFVPGGTAPGAGYLVYGRNGSLFAAAFDTRTLKAGPPGPVLEGVQGIAGLVVFGVSESGSLAYAAGAGLPNLIPLSTLVWVDRKGAEQPVSAPARDYAQIRLSPDGGRIAAQIMDFSQGVSGDLWVYDLARRTLNRVTFENFNLDPVWTPDGTRLIHTAGQLAAASQSLFSTTPDGSGQPQLLWKGEPVLIPMSVSHDGVLIGFRPDQGSLNAPGGSLLVLKLDPGGAAAGGKPKPFLDARFIRGEPRFSPDGKWVAFQSDQSGTDEVYVAPYPGPGPIVPISSGGGTQPRWNGNGRELFFRNGPKLMAVDVEASAAFHALAPHELFEKAGSPIYDASPDGRRFLMLKPAPSAGGSGSPPSDLHVIVNWVDQLRRQVPPVK